MLRAALMDMSAPVDHDGFRFRGTEVSRLEGLTDGVFALAVTLLILSAEVPRSYSDMLEMIKGLPAFAVSFSLIMWFWFEHYQYSRRYGLLDRTTIALNSALIFVVLFYVYPLKALFTELFDEMFFHHAKDPNGNPFVEAEQWPSLFLLYGLGYASVAGVFWMMYWHALRRRAQLELNAIEVVLTHKTIAGVIGRIGVAALSITCAYVLPLKMVSIAGLVYALTGPYEGLIGWYYGRKVGRMQAAAKVTPTPDARSSSSQPSAQSTTATDTGQR